MNSENNKIVTVTLNPAIDRIISLAKFKPFLVNKVEEYSDIVGGKGINVAKVLKDLQIDSICSGFLGSHNEDIFVDFFNKNNLEDKFFRFNGSTRVNIKIKSDHDKVTEINFPNQDVNNEDIDSLIEYLLSLNCHYYVLSGSLPISADIVSYKKIITALKNNGKYVVLDSSSRALKIAIEGKPNIIKPNIEELNEAFNGSFSSVKDILDISYTLINNGIEVVITSLGKEGAIFVNKDEAYKITSKPKIVINTVGAGDSMVGGFLAGVYKGLSFLETAKLSSTCALSSIQMDGVGFNKGEKPEDYHKFLTVTKL